MTKKRWSTQQLKEILGEPYTIGPRGHSEPDGQNMVSPDRTVLKAEDSSADDDENGIVAANFSFAPVVKIGTKELETGEQPGSMEWNCVGGNPREQLYKVVLDVQTRGNAAFSLKRDDVQQILANYLGCKARVDLDDADLWVMERVCHKHYPVLGEGSD